MLALVASNKYVISEALEFISDANLLDSARLIEVLEHIILGVSDWSGKPVVGSGVNYEFYYFNEFKGLYELNVFLERKVTRDIPPWKICQPIRQTLIAKDLKTFEVLYGT